MTYKPPTRNDFYVDLTFDGRPAGSMLRDDWETLLLCIDPNWSFTKLRDFVKAQNLKTTADIGTIIINIKKHQRGER